LDNGKLSHYKVDEIEVLFNQTPEKVSEVEQETKSEVLTDLFLSPENRVKDTAAAYQKAKYSDKTTFWFVSA
jgi:RPA family protein